MISKAGPITFGANEKAALGRCVRHTPHEVLTMSTARVFRSGNSQAVRLPKEFRFDSDEVEIFRRGDEVVLREKARDMQRAYQLLTELPDDFLRDGRNEIPPQARERCR
jgi:antitoxin VapB